MKFPVDGEWWKDLFDELYLRTDARTVCDDELTSREVDFLEQVLAPDRSKSILDLCGGQGRHSLELSRRGFTDVTVLDYSDHLIEIGKRRAREEGLDTVFVQGDARDTGFETGRFNFVFIMASSFGYFPEEEENLKILFEASRVLRNGGTILVDLPDMEYVVSSYNPESTHRVDEDIVVHRMRRLEGDLMVSRERVMSGDRGCLRDRTYCIRLYSPGKIEEMITRAGFSSVSVERNFMNRERSGDFGCMTNRMIVVGRKE